MECGFLGKAGRKLLVACACSHEPSSATRDRMLPRKCYSAETSLNSDVKASTTCWGSLAAMIWAA
ncbi:hypothetical protein ATTO_00460 [Leptogranulimonas caecicola]|uniref:Uncharacterized protein n=1 Tax=Leptogranulimonas caecicola TaxID=2894156 RepID=A0AAU9D160_9ACTN|nr:hypothetical protein ATTO_00460 [Leptogranulimonas caecicola]